MKRLNLLKKYPHYYSSKEAPELIEVEKAKFISIHARGSFTDKIFYDRIEALTHTTHAVKELFENSDQAFDTSSGYGMGQISRNPETMIYGTGSGNDMFQFQQMGGNGMGMGQIGDEGLPLGAMDLMDRFDMDDFLSAEGNLMF